MFIPRMSVHWGDSSQTECVLRLMEAALSTGEEYLYLHLLSGSDLQIKQTEQIHDFFDEHPENQFLAPLIVKVVVSKNIYFLFVHVIRYCSVPDHHHFE